MMKNKKKIILFMHTSFIRNIPIILLSDDYLDLWWVNF